MGTAGGVAGLDFLLHGADVSTFLLGGAIETAMIASCALHEGLGTATCRSFATSEVEKDLSSDLPGKCFGGVGVKTGVPSGLLSGVTMSGVVSRPRRFDTHLALGGVMMVENFGRLQAWDGATSSRLTWMWSLVEGSGTTLTEGKLSTCVSAAGDMDLGCRHICHCVHKEDP